METNHNTVVVINFGAQYAQLIARRVREARVFSVIVPYSATTEEILHYQPSAIILSGGPASVFEKNAPQLNPEILKLGIPILGICYGFQAIAQSVNGTVAQNDSAEYGRTEISIIDTAEPLFAGQPKNQDVWMSHRDAVVSLPDSFIASAKSPAAAIAAFHNERDRIYGLQWHPEVVHTPYGQQTLQTFLYDIAGCKPTWLADEIIEMQVDKIRDTVQDKHVLCALSGGVDSAVAAALVHKAIGDQLTCVFVDNGLLRKGEKEQVISDFAETNHIRLYVEEAETEFLRDLQGITEPEAKRKIIGNAFIRAFERASKKVADAQGIPSFDYLVQGTLYPDVVESGSATGTSVIKSHHNVGGLPDDMEFKLIEPLRDLFKDEVREVGEALGLKKKIVWRHPFPGPGLAVRIIGEVTKEHLKILADADKIVTEELEKADVSFSLWQCPVVLLANVRSVGVQGDARTYGMPAILRPVVSQDAMTADWARLDYDLLAKISSRITNEVAQITRVALDITSKPPASIEWE